MFKRIYNKLLNEFGPQGWWPINGKCNKNNFEIPKNRQQEFEIILGTVLTQNTSWKNVEKALQNLRKAGLNSPSKILKMQDKKLSELIRPAGYFNQKAKYLKNISEFIGKNKNLQKLPVKKLRAKLLSIKGIGPETADSIILYAFKKPCFVVDLYTKRIFSRLGICDKKISYHELQNKFHKKIPKQIKIYNEYHALLVELAKKHCTKIPACANCPVTRLCKKSL
ncbi:endonuclease [Candidatus Woesearchaeota archaeon]|nr:endonuclease [Candidatus Woesearchaeota archaeon]